ncbi:MAG: hypothetical protein K6F30_00180 [Lachnospiraceae bacterium]|nr:hypothetical protein [Lachnospiraceae bacterium]
MRQGVGTKEPFDEERGIFMTYHRFYNRVEMKETSFWLFLLWRLVFVIKIASLNGKENIQNMMNTSDILFVSNNKKRISAWRLTTGLQLPIVSSNTNSNLSIAPETEKSTTTS